MTQTIIKIPAAGAFDPTDIEITDGVDDAFLIKDTSGDEWFKIDTRPGTPANGQFSIVMAPTSGQRVLIGGPNGSSGGPFSPLMIVNQNADSFAMRVYGDYPYGSSSDNQFLWGRDSIQSRWIHPLGGRFDSSSSSGNFTFRDSSNANMFVLDDNTSATFTLDPSNSAVFKVQDNSANEYIKVDTTSGSEQIVLKGRPTSAANAGLYLTDQPFLQGTSSQYIQMVGSGVTLETGIAGKRLDVKIGNSGNSFRVLGTSSAERFKVLDDSNATFTLDPSNNAVFKVQDNAGTPNDYIKLDTTSTSELATIKAGGTQGISISGNSRTDLITGSTTSASDVRILNSGGTQIFRVQGNHDTTIRAANFKITDAATNTAYLQTDTNTNFTYTLDDTSGATFKVTDDGASPKLFFSATEGGNTFVQSDSNTFLDGGGAIYLRVGTTNRLRADGGALYLGGSGKLNIIDTGTPLFIRSPNLVSAGATTTTTVVNIQDDGAYKKITCNPSTTGQTFTFEFQDAASTNRDYVIEQHFAIHNSGTENCTIQATVTSGRGSALGKDLSAGGSTSGELVTGMTLNAGKSAVFKAVKWSKELAGTAGTADNRFMFQTIMVEA